MGRRNALANRAIAAANSIAAGNIVDATDELESLLVRIDGASPPSDWMDESPVQATMRNSVQLLLDLIALQ
jgi:hypothetical protein